MATDNREGRRENSILAQHNSRVKRINNEYRDVHSVLVSTLLASIQL